jgi:hypothetical protein
VTGKFNFIKVRGESLAFFFSLFLLKLRVTAVFNFATNM